MHINLSASDLIQNCINNNWTSLNAGSSKRCDYSSAFAVFEHCAPMSVNMDNSAFSALASVQSIRSAETSLCAAFISHTLSDTMCWCISFVDHSDMQHDILIIQTGRKLPSLPYITGLLLDDVYAINRTCVTPFAWNKRGCDTSLPAFDLTFIGYHGIQDFASLSSSSYDVMPHLTQLGNGAVTLKNSLIRPCSAANCRKYFKVRLTIRDTSCFLPSKVDSIRDIAHTVCVNTAAHNPAELSDLFAVNTIALRYISTIYGVNRQLPITNSSASVKAAKTAMSAYFGSDQNDLFESRYRGLHYGSVGSNSNGSNGGFHQVRQLVPVSSDAGLLQMMASSSYHGGLNSASFIGYFTNETFDYDLISAYPTAMCLVRDPDWNHLNLHVITDRYLTLADFKTPYDICFGEITFEFPESVQYPCIAVESSASTGLVFPRTGTGSSHAIYAAGPDIYLALQLGAKVFAKRFIAAAAAPGKSSDDTGSLKSAVTQLVRDREMAQKIYHKGSVQDMLLKDLVNFLYGKTGQNIRPKKTWSAKTNRMISMSDSQITSPVHAAMITSIVRAVLFACMNELDAKGYKSYSVTTDGFISDAPKNVLDNLSLYGFADGMTWARRQLSGSPRIWQEKHHQNDLLNICTRGNVSMRCLEKDGYEGVCAHNGFTTGEKKDSYQDRLSFMTQVLSRTGRLESVTMRSTPFKKMAVKSKRSREAYSEHQQIVRISMDYDFKRKPVRSSFYTVFPEVNGRRYETANFATRPYESIEEFEFYVKAKNKCSVLRTINDWNIFWKKLEKQTKKQAENLENNQNIYIIKSDDNLDLKPSSSDTSKIHRISNNEEHTPNINIVRMALQMAHASHKHHADPITEASVNSNSNISIPDCRTHQNKNQIPENTTTDSKRKSNSKHPTSKTKIISKKVLTSNTTKISKIAETQKKLELQKKLKDSRPSDFRIPSYRICPTKNIPKIKKFQRRISFHSSIQIPNTGQTQTHKIITCAGEWGGCYSTRAGPRVKHENKAQKASLQSSKKRG